MTARTGSRRTGSNNKNEKEQKKKEKKKRKKKKKKKLERPNPDSRVHQSPRGPGASPFFLRSIHLKVYVTFSTSIP